MSAGAVFRLIANDGKADRMLMATKLLNQRIKDVMCARTAAGKADVTPTLVDLELTHVLYVNAHFKPFAAIGFEYNKVMPNSGKASLGTGVTFSIPQFGDFFHDMVCRVRLSACAAASQLTPLQGTAQFPANDVTNPLHTVKYNLVDAVGNTLVSQTNYSRTPYQVAYRNFTRYCEYPGNRLFSSVKFDVNGNPLDEYDDLVSVMLEKFCTPPNKRAGYNRLVGQEVPLTGYSGLDYARVTDADYKNTPAAVITRADAAQSNQTVALYATAQLSSATPNAATGAPIGATGAPTVLQSAVIPLNPAGQVGPALQNQFDVSRKLNQVVNGPQTPKPQQAPLEIWNKLRFWFNDDVRLSIPSVSIPFGQRFITIELCAANQLVFEFPSVYLETVAEDVNADGTQRYKKTYSPLTQFAGFSAPPVIDIFELYINNIFVNPEIHDIYIKRIGFSLIRVYRQQDNLVAEGEGNQLLSQLKWPIEYMFMGMRPKWNTTVPSGANGNQNMWRDWHRLTRLVDATSDQTIPLAAPVAPLDMSNYQGASIAELPFSNLDSYVGKVMPDNYWLPVSTVDSLALTSHGINIYEKNTDIFFSSYMPFHYGGASLCTPEDPGAMFINMALFPRSYQPSGHLNVSRARETYIKWSSTYISQQTPTELHIVAVALNFLLITDGSAVLRYST